MIPIDVKEFLLARGTDINTAASQPTCEDQIAQVCQEVTDGKLLWQLTTKFDDTFWFQALVVFSLFMNIITFFVMWRIKELQAHPMQLFMIITACDAMVLQGYILQNHVCSLNLQKLFMWTTHFSSTCEYELSSLLMLLNGSSFLILFPSVFGIWQ